jgi:hypothetical protein
VHSSLELRYEAVVALEFVPLRADRLAHAYEA